MASRRRKTKTKRISRWQRVINWAAAHALGLLMILLGLLIVVYLSLWIVFVLPQYYIQPTECSNLPLAVSLRYPHYVAVGSEGFVEVGLRNTGTQPISGTAVIAFDGDLSIHPLPSTTTFLSFSALPPDGMLADQVRFTLIEPPIRLRGTLPFTVQVTADQVCVPDLPIRPLRLAPLPGLGATFSGALSITALALLWEPIKALTGLLGEQIKKRWFPDKKKRR